jgi:hypothetical protein
MVSSIGGWVRSGPIRDLVREFGGDLPDLAVSDALAWLDEFSASHWDFRQKTGPNVERDQVAVPDFSAATAALVNDVASALGMVHAQEPPRSAYDHVLILGGLARACLQRTSHAAYLLGSAVDAGHVAALGSFRPLGAHETDLLKQLGEVECVSEVDAMDAGIRRAFGYSAPQEEHSEKADNPHLSWLVRTYRAAGRPPVDVLAAPSTEPAIRRANTPDTYDFWADQVTLSATDRVLVVTSPIYVPFQHCDAVRTLGIRYGCGIDTVGFDPAAITDPLLRQSVDPDRYLQEIRSAVRSMQWLFRALAPTVKA